MDKVNETQIKNKLILYFKNILGVEIKDDSKLFKDLEIWGDDVDIFLINFIEKFDVDFSDLVIDKYFIPEYNILEWIYYRTFQTAKLNKDYFSLNHLVEVVKKGKWFDPDI